MLQRVQLLKKYLWLPPVLPYLPLGHFTGILHDELLLREAVAGVLSWEARSCGSSWLELLPLLEVAGFLVPSSR